MRGVKILILVALITVSCQQKSVQLPTLDVKGIQDTVYNNSKIWLFYTLKGSDTIVELNKNNSIANTHWIFNIDKRLLLKHVVPFVQQLQGKKEKPSMHDNGEISHSYYSYVDTISNKLSLILFDSIKYITHESIYSDSILTQKSFKHLLIDYKKNDFSVNKVPVQMGQLDDYISKQKDSNLVKIHLNLDENLSYQNYIYLKALLQNIKNDSVIISKEEYIN
jgi:hypothetical protein